MDKWTVSGPTEAAAAQSVAGDPEEELESVLQSITKKADKHKFRARSAVVLMTACSALIPVCIAAIPDGWAQKTAVSALSAIAVITGSLAQLERPHERWALYRRYQRMLQVEQRSYRFRCSPYDGAGRERALMNRLSELEAELHLNWEGVIPSSLEIESAAGNRQ